MISEPRQRRNARRGFTLLELILAGSISVLVLITVTTSLARIGQARLISQDKLIAYLRADSALQNLRRDAASTIRDSDLFNSRVLLINNSRSMNVGGNKMDLGRDDLLIFAHRLRPLGQIEYNGEGLEYETQYRVDDDQIGPALWQRRDPVPDDNPAGGGIATPITEGVIGLDIEGYDGESWYEDWDSDIDGLPWALRFTVTAVGAEDPANAYERPGSVVSLMTQVAIDRIIPPYEEPEEPEEEEEQLDPEAGAGEMSVPGGFGSPRGFGPGRGGVRGGGGGVRGGGGVVCAARGA